MKIRKLGIKSFGKFKDKEIKFEDGLNVIYGNNEAGKSTAHKFIQGVFFGFFKPYSKNKIYSYEYKKYKPWNSDLYKGSLEFNIGKREYRIERNFDKQNEEFKLFDNITAARNNEEVKKAVASVEKELGEDGRILVRESGTEPVIRVMVEAKKDAICREMVQRVIEVMDKEGLILS